MYFISNDEGGGGGKGPSFTEKINAWGKTTARKAPLEGTQKEERTIHVTSKGLISGGVRGGMGLRKRGDGGLGEEGVTPVGYEMWGGVRGLKGGKKKRSDKRKGAPNQSDWG